MTDPDPVRKKLASIETYVADLAVVRDVLDRLDDLLTFVRALHGVIRQET